MRATRLGLVYVNTLIRVFPTDLDRAYRLPIESGPRRCTPRLRPIELFRLIVGYAKWKKFLPQPVAQRLRSGWRFNIVLLLGWLSEFLRRPMLDHFGTGLSSTIEFIRCETEQPVDDIMVGSSDGRLAFVQVKRSLSLERSSEAPFAKTFRPFVRQTLRPSVHKQA